MAGEKKSNGKIIGLIVGVVAVVAAVVLVIALVNKGDSIKTIAQFKEAITEKRALNCTITSPDSEDVIMQTTEGFKKVKLITSDPDISDSRQFVLMIEGDATYMWDEDKTMAFKMDDTSMLDGFIDEII